MGRDRVVGYTSASGTESATEGMGWRRIITPSHSREWLLASMTTFMCGNAGLVGCPIRAKRAMIRLFARMDPEVRPEVRSLCGSICASVQECESQANAGHCFTISTWTACPCRIGSGIERGTISAGMKQGRVCRASVATQIVRGGHES